MARPSAASVCPAVIAADEQWKMGQFKPGDKIRFHPVARAEDPIAGPIVKRIGDNAGSPILGRRDDGEVPVVYRRQGDDNLLVEYGPMRSMSACAFAAIF